MIKFEKRKKDGKWHVLGKRLKTDLYLINRQWES